jgi:hypothetical protein
VLGCVRDRHDGALAFARSLIADAVVSGMQSFFGVMMCHHDEIDVVQFGKSRYFISCNSTHQMAFEPNAIHVWRRLFQKAARLP